MDDAQVFPIFTHLYRPRAFHAYLKFAHLAIIQVTNLFLVVHDFIILTRSLCLICFPAVLISDRNIYTIYLMLYSSMLYLLLGLSGYMIYGTIYRFLEYRYPPHLS